MDSNGSIFSAENRQQLEQSFKEFASRRENKPLLEQHQRDEVAAAVELQERVQQMDLEQEVSCLDPVDIKLLAPVLNSPTLRQLLVSLKNDASLEATTSSSSSSNSSSGLKFWVSNPAVLKLLREAARALRNGRITEQQLAALLQHQCKAMQADQASASEPSAAPHQAMLPSHLLVEALNEHLSERYAGNKAYQQRDHSTAMHHYERALAVVNFVVGASPDDQAEVMHNKAAVLLNMAAVHMALQEWGAAVRCCDDALQIPQSTDAVVKAWLRRSKANLGRHEYQEALQDLQTAHDLDPWNEDIQIYRTAVLTARREAAHNSDKVLAVKMLRT